MVMNSSFWKDKKVLVTGHTGFKGGWLSVWLLELGADVIGYALQPKTNPSFFESCNLDQRMKSIIGNICNKGQLTKAVEEYNPEIIFHLAAQPLVRYSYDEPVETFLTNVMGTVYLLEVLRKQSCVRSLVNITTDKVYENQEWVWGYREADALGGHDPYSTSKACAELVTIAYNKSFYSECSMPTSVATVRSGNVIGGGDWSKDRIIPDIIRALEEGKPAILRNPQSVRPWQHVLDPLAGYLTLAEKLYDNETDWTGAWNFGPKSDDIMSVELLCNAIIRYWGKGMWKSLTEANPHHETNYLKLDCSKSRQVLGWQPCLRLEEAIEMTVEWYKQASKMTDSDDICDITTEQIKRYEAKLRAK
ncbi:MAG: CDP-glucose 4,6-dehydratase [bacterium]